MRKEAAIVAGALVVLLMASARLYAADHYVSPSGSAAWSACVSPGIHCSARTAMASAQAGDTVYFRGGTYTVGPQWGNTPEYGDLMPANSGAAGQPITFRKYAAETPLINGVATGGTICLGAVNVNYIVWDGFVCQVNDGVGAARAYFFNTTGSVLRNTTINGGTTVITSTDNVEGLRIEQSTNFTASNLKIYNFRQTTNWPNTAGVKMYHNAGGVLENLEIYNCSAGIHDKSDNDDWVIRNNFIHDCARAIYVTPVLEVMQSDRGKLYNNLLVNNAQQGIEFDNDFSGYHGNDWEIYNNTIYNSWGMTLTANETGHGWNVYNNIVDVPNGQMTTKDACTLASCDHNQWGSGGVRIVISLYRNQRVYTSLAAWQASTELEGGGHPGTGDLASDSLFLNGSGTLTQKNDFVLASNSPARGAGRNGVDMGARNISTAVGYSDAPGQPLAAPRNVIIKAP